MVLLQIYHTLQMPQSLETQKGDTLVVIYDDCAGLHSNVAQCDRHVVYLSEDLHVIWQIDAVLFILVEPEMFLQSQSVQTDGGYDVVLTRGVNLDFDLLPFALAPDIEGVVLLAPSGRGSLPMALFVALS